MSPLETHITSQIKLARQASRELAKAGSTAKNKALLLMADKLEASEAQLIATNRLDLEAAEKAGISGAMLDRLTLTTKRIKQMAEGVRQVATLPDPVGTMGGFTTRPNGLQVGKMRVPLGVIGFIYESRPNVTVDAASLCLKSGNAVVLKGGSEAIHSNRALVVVLRQSLVEAGLDENAVTFLDTTDREAVNILATRDEDVDVIIPRGGEGLIRAVAKAATVPVIKHYKGVCHVYVDECADLSMARNIVYNGKVQRPGVCNALETVLVHVNVAGEVLPLMGEDLLKVGVELRGCHRTRALIPQALAATEDDWYAEYLELILAVRVVDTFDMALDHIEKYGSKHTDTIVTKDYNLARRFLAEVDSSSVMVNASTRFSDGFEYGLGAEIGISTDKLHARGPMGLDSLTCEKWIVLGNGQIRDGEVVA